VRCLRKYLEAFSDVSSGSACEDSVIVKESIDSLELRAGGGRGGVGGALSSCDFNGMT